jgi:hypothetical protein
MSGYSEVRASASIYHPQAGEMGISRGEPGAHNEHRLYLDIARSAYIALGDPGEVAGEIAALHKLAGLATEAAAELERWAVTS